MEPLPNLRQETFCQLVAAGKSAAAAYAAAYGRRRDVTCRVNGRRLLTNTNIRQRIEEIRREAAAASFPTLQRVIDELGCSAVEQIRTSPFRRACKAAEQFATVVNRLCG
jgi:phage terminase small subunit